MANDEIQRRLEEAFAASGLTQAALSRASGIDRSSISLYLSGRYKPKADKLLRLAAALSVTPEWLSGMEANAPEPSALLPVAQELDEQGGLRFTEERVPVPRSFLHGGDSGSFFILRVTGLAMYPRLLSGDCLLVERPPNPRTAPSPYWCRTAHCWCAPSPANPFCPPTRNIPPERWIAPPASSAGR